MKTEFNKYECSAVVGYWRMGLDSATIAAIMGSTLFPVDKAILDRKLQIQKERMNDISSKKMKKQPPLRLTGVASDENVLLMRE